MDSDSNVGQYFPHDSNRLLFNINFSFHIWKKYCDWLHINVGRIKNNSGSDSVFCRSEPLSLHGSVWNSLMDIIDNPFAYVLHTDD